MCSPVFSVFCCVVLCSLYFPVFCVFCCVVLCSLCFPVFCVFRAVVLCSLCFPVFCVFCCVFCVLLCSLCSPELCVFCVLLGTFWFVCCVFCVFCVFCCACEGFHKYIHIYICIHILSQYCGAMQQKNFLSIIRVKTIIRVIAVYVRQPNLLFWPNLAYKGQPCDRPGAMQVGSAGHGVLVRLG